MSQHHSVVAVSGWALFGLPTWGRSFWQDHNDGNLILLYASGDNEVDYVTSSTSGETWSAPSFAFSVDTYGVHNNFDTAMDRQGHVHCLHRWQSSGCYSVLGKNHMAGTWAPSGETRGFITAGDSGLAKGVNGSIEVSQEALAAPALPDFATVFGQAFPCVRLVAKDANNFVRLFYLGAPFDNYPVEDTTFNNVFSGTDNALYLNAGREGGYPVFTNTGSKTISGNNRRYPGEAVTYLVDGTGFLHTIQRTAGGFDWRAIQIPVKDIAYTAGTPDEEGYVARLAFGPTMARASATTVLNASGTTPSGIPLHLFLVSQSGNHRTNFTLLGASKEIVIDTATPEYGSWFGNVDSSGFYADPSPAFGVGSLPEVGLLARCPNGITFEDNIPKNVLSYYQPSGVLVDISWRNQPQQLHLYFLTYDTNGEQVISRMLCDVRGDWWGGFAGTTFYPPQRMLVTLPSVSHSVSGLHSWAPAGQEHVGGSGLFAVWNNFKALRHAVFQHEGAAKHEMVVTAGSGLDNQYRLVVWDYDLSIDASAHMRLPTYVRRLTGTLHNYTGILQEEAQGLIDGNYPSGLILDTGDSVAIDFGANQIVNRFEALFSGPNLFESVFNYSLSGSLDGTVWYPVLQQQFHWTEGTSGSGLLLKVSSESDTRLGDTAPNANAFQTVFSTLHPFVSRYVTLHMDAGGLWQNNGSQQAYIHGLRFYGVHTTKGFISTGSNNFPSTLIEAPKAPLNLPETFRDVEEGDIPYNWRNTGNVNWFVRGSGTTTQDGIVNDYNIFQGLSNGRGDGFAARTPVSGVPVGQSGTLEITVNVNADEIAHDGRPGRTISFDMRYDLIGSGLTLSENNSGDDQVIFRAITPTGTMSVFYPGNFPTDPDEFCGASFCDWFNYRTTIPTGQSVLQWIYQRGFNTPPGVFDDEGNVWLDNVAGLRLVYRPSIFGYLEGRAPNTSDSTGPSGIWGYMGVIIDNLDTPVFGWMSGSLSAGGSTNPTGSINAYLLSIPTATGSVNAFVEGKLADNIAAFIEGGVNSSGAINAYMVSSGAISSIFAYMGTMISESINAYLLAPSGTMSAINGYLITPEISVINGYISGPGTGNTTINAYLNANGYQSSIYGYVLCSGQPSGSINGYLFNNGTSSNINAYMSCGVSSGINAYMYGAAVSTGVINAWISGVGHQVSAINAYLMGISGSISGSINCYMNAHLFEDGMIYSHMIGFDDPDACDFPLSTLPSFTIPTGNFYQ